MRPRTQSLLIASLLIGSASPAQPSPQQSVLGPPEQRFHDCITGHSTENISQSGVEGLASGQLERKLLGGEIRLGGDRRNLEIARTQVATLATTIDSKALLEACFRLVTGQRLYAQQAAPPQEKIDLILAQRLATLSAPVRITYGSRTFSLNAKFLGATEKYTGDLGGYAGAKQHCEAKFTPSSHMCSFDELQRSAQLGMEIPTGWFLSGHVSNNGSKDQYEFNDCRGWTTASGYMHERDDPAHGVVQGARFGSLWLGHPVTEYYGASIGRCSKQYPILCCD